MAEWLSESMFSTEEDIRCKLLVPYLSALGISPQNVKTERSFRLRLGKMKLVSNPEDRRETVRGRLDVLVTNSKGENLFVVELKSDGAELTDEDTEQAISYARLLPQIAPFALITNGREAMLFDTITTNEIKLEALGERWTQWRGGHALPTTADLRIRYEALKHFLGYSHENVRGFCHAQLADRMRSLKAEDGGRDRKYLPDVYVSRGGIRDAISTFVDGPYTMFVLAGESGVGKTNEMCAIAEELLSKHFVLFYNGAELFGSLRERIADDFNWHFTDELSLSKICERVSELGDSLGCKALIVIDGIDETRIVDIQYELGDLARHVRSLGTSVKVIVSLKSSNWQEFASLRSNPSPLLDAMMPPHERTAPQAGQAVTTAIPEPSATLRRFSPNETESAIALYRARFGLRGAFSRELTHAAEDPLLLRLICEVYADGLGQLPRDIGEELLLQQYLATKLAKMRDGNQAERELIGVARASMLHAESLQDDFSHAGSGLDPADRAGEAAVTEDQIAGAMPQAGRELTYEIVEHGIVSCFRDSMGRRYFRFVYDRVRDFIVASRVLRFDRLQESEFEAVLKDSLRNRIMFEALLLYLRAASDEHWSITRRFAEQQGQVPSCV